MDKVQYFITLMAWVGAIFCSIKTVALTVWDYEYNNTPRGKLEKLMDNMNAVVCIIWLVVYYFV
jgi:hypothetical protein